MGDPKKQRPKFSKPSHPWQKERIIEEAELRKEYGVKNKTELWKLNSKLRNYAAQAKRLTAKKTGQNKKQAKLLLEKLVRLGILPENSQMDNVLAISLKDIMERRLQTLVYRKGLAKSIKQARQFITHRHIMVDGKKITSPNFLVPQKIEDTINFAPNSQLSDEMHPERKKEEKMTKKPEAKESKKEEKKDAKKKEDKKAKTPKTGKKETAKEKKEEKPEAREEKKDTK